MSHSEEKPTLLIVDDESVNIEILAKYLQAEYRVLFTTDPLKAVEMAERTLPDLILMDVVMPGIDGYEACRRLKARAITREIPVIFVTAMHEAQYEVIGFDVGGVDYITKPVKSFLLRARVRTHVELKRKTDYLHRLATLDGLTGIPNRRRLDEFLRQEWNRGVRKQDSFLSLMLIDVDYFKKYNDHYGHQAGDHCLQAVAGILADVLERATDLVARYGGEEFACVLPDTPLEGAIHTAEKIQQRMAALAIPHAKSDLPGGCVTLSIGVVSMMPVKGREPESLVAAADLELYAAKKNGRNRIEYGATV
ncbi:MAG: diguanylate cyclase [Magnetococcales bacterium]|nr:diguanylate cyclase [Magnetococcales bacterium]